MREYEKGKRYARKLDRLLFKDILHDAYVHWFNKTGTDLFLEPNGTVCKVIKLTYYGYYISKNLRNRKSVIYYETDKYTTLTPEQVTIDRDEVSNLYSRIYRQYPSMADNMIQSIKLNAEGYKQHEIAEKLNFKRVCIARYFNKIRGLYGVNQESL